MLVSRAINGKWLQAPPVRRKAPFRLEADRCEKRTWLLVILVVSALHGCAGSDQWASGNDKPPKGEGAVKVQFERSGGFTGIKRAVTVDSQSLPPGEARELKERVERADFFNLPTEIIGQKGADQFVYTLTVESEGRRHTVRTGDTAAPERLKPLIEWLTAQARASSATSRPK